MSEAFFHDVMNVNALTTFLCCQASRASPRPRAPSSISRRSRRTTAAAGASVYSQGRRARAHEGLHEDCAAGIRVNAVSPGLIGGTPFPQDLHT